MSDLVSSNLLEVGQILAEFVRLRFFYIRHAQLQNIVRITRLLFSIQKRRGTEADASVYTVIVCAPNRSEAGSKHGF